MEYFFSNTFFFNVIPSLLFIAIITINSIGLCHYLIKKKILISNNYNLIIIFYGIFGFLSIIINHLFLFNLLDNYFLYLILFLLATSSLITIYFLPIIKIIFIIKKIIIRNLYLYIIIFSLLLISFLPMTDADSLVYSNISSQLFKKGEINLTDNYIESRLISGSDILLTISFAIKSNSLGAFLNSFSLLLLCTALIKENKKYSALFILATPLIIYFVSAQKLQLFFGILYFSLFLSFNKDKKNHIKNTRIYLYSFLTVFYATGKINNLLFAFPIFIYFLLNLKNNKKIIFALFCILNFFLLYFPILLKKYLIFNDPFSPFLEFIKENPNDDIKNLTYIIRSSFGWLDSNNILINIFSIFIPTNITNLSSSLGLGAIILLFPFLLKINKQTFSLIIINIFFIIAAGQLIPRYYFESYLLLSDSMNSFRRLIYKKLFVAVLYVQSGIILFFSLYFLALSINLFRESKNSELYLSRFSYNYNLSKSINSLDIKENILDLMNPRMTYYFRSNYYPSMLFLPYKDYDKKKKIVKFIKKNSIVYIISDNNTNLIPECLDIMLHKKIEYLETRRNFLLTQNKELRTIYKIVKNNC